jgi:tRNA U-34 5-methylaminomethyl-2-thiouridine biosynthesis protein MnmC
MDVAMVLKHAPTCALLLGQDNDSLALFAAHLDMLANNQGLHLMLFIDQAEVIQVHLSRLRTIAHDDFVLPSFTHGVYRIMHRPHQSVTLYLGPYLNTIKDQSHYPDYWFMSKLSHDLACLLLKRSHEHTLYALSHPADDAPYHQACPAPLKGHWLQQQPWRRLIRDYRQACLMADPPSFRIQPHDPWLTPWFHDTPYKPWAPLATDSHILVVGAGIAGASTARSLADQGYQVTVIDAAQQAAQGASGNPMGILYPNLSPHRTVQTDLLCSAYPWVMHLLRTSCRHQESCYQITSLCDNQTWPQAAFNAFNPAFLQSRAISSSASTAHLLFPHAAWVRPVAWIEQLLNHPRISSIFNQRIHRLDWQAQAAQWLATSTNAQQYQADAIILAHADQAHHLAQTAHLPLHAIRGQVSMVQATHQSQADPMIYCHHSYLTPAYANEHCIGASFDPHHTHLAIRDHDTAANLLGLATLRPSTYASLIQAPHHQPRIMRERVSLRASTPDYLPLVGAVSPPDDFFNTYAPLRKDRKKRSHQPCPRWPRLYVNVGHGTRGLLTAPLAAAMIAAQLSGQPLPVSRLVEEALHPNRFLWRTLIQSNKANPSSA